MPAALIPLLALALAGAAYAAYRFRRATTRGDRALAGLAALVTVASLALSAQALAARSTTVPAPVPAPGCAHWVASASVGPSHLTSTGHAVCLPPAPAPAPAPPK